MRLASEHLRNADQAHAFFLRARTAHDRLPKGIGIVRAQVIRKSGLVEAPLYGWNARVNAGATQQNANMFGTAGATFQYLACSPTTITPAMGDTALSGEITTGGFIRALAAFAYAVPTSVGGTFTQTLTKTFTGTAAWTVNAIALFNQLAIGGTMFSEIGITTASGVSGDQLAVTYTITA